MRRGPRIRQITGLGLTVLCALIPVAAAVPDEEEGSVLFRYRRVEGNEAPRLLERTSILVGRIEFSAEPADRTGHEILDLRVQSDTALLDGRPGELCRGSASGGCVFDFGDKVYGYRLTLVASVTDAPERPPEPVVREVSTFGANAADPAGLFGDRAIGESAESRSHPDDQVSRSVRVTSVEGKGRSKQWVPVPDLTREKFIAEAGGIGEVEIVSVEPPAPHRDCVVPLVWNVGAYVTSGRDGAAWTPDHGPMVQMLREAFRAAARAGYDCESMVVEYASVSRPLFGPFRLHPGRELSETRLAENVRVLDALVAHLSRDPSSEWAVQYTTATGTATPTDFLSVYHTLNDLLRGYPGLKSLLLLTGGTDEPSRSKRVFQKNLWPERIEALNPEWPEERLSTLLERLDHQTGEYDDQLADLIARLDLQNLRAEVEIAAFMGRVDPGGLSALHPHRKDVWPPVEVLLHSAGRGPGSRESLLKLAPMLGGSIWHLAPGSIVADEPIAAHPGEDRLNLAEALLAVARHIHESYVVELTVPNPRQDGKQRDLRFRLRERSGKTELHYMSTYVSSPPQERKIHVYAASPFKELRLLAAYRLRDYAFHEELYDLLRDRWSAEQDEQVRRVLFETWISVNLQRLQAVPGQVSSATRRKKLANDAFTNLTGLSPARYPDPRLAADAGSIAERYRARFPDRF